MKLENKKGNKILSFFRSKNESEISNLYNRYRDDFAYFISKIYTIDKSVICDIYQESFIVVFSKVKSGELNELKSSFKTYLFAVGKYKASNYIRQNAKSSNSEFNTLEFDIDYSSNSWAQMQEIVYPMVLKMGEPCNMVLSLYYWEKKSHKEIANIMGYKSEQVAKNKKGSCFGALKTSLMKKLKEEDLI